MELVGLHDYLRSLRFAVQKALGIKQDRFQEIVEISKPTWNRQEIRDPISDHAFFDALTNIRKELSAVGLLDRVRREVRPLVDAAREQFALRGMLDQPLRAKLSEFHREKLLELTQHWALDDDESFATDVVEICLNRAAAHRDRWEFHQALFALRIARQLAPADLTVQLRTGQAYLYLREGDHLGHWKTAFDLLNQEIPRNFPLWCEWHALLGIAWFRHPHHPEHLSNAEHALRTAIGSAHKEREIDLASWQSNLGVVLIEQGEPAAFKEAVEYFEQACAIWTRFGRKYELAITKMRLANYRQIAAHVCPHAPERTKGFNKALEDYRDSVRMLDDKDMSMPVASAEVKYNWADAERKYALHSSGAKRHHRLNNAVRWCDEALRSLSAGNGKEFGLAHYNRAEALYYRAVTLCPEPIDDDVERVLCPEIWHHTLASHDGDASFLEFELKDRAEAIDSLTAAAASLLETLQIFHRRYIPTEWSDTHFLLAKVHRKHWSLSQARSSLQMALASVRAALSFALPAYPKFAWYEALESRLIETAASLPRADQRACGKTLASQAGVLPESTSGRQLRLLKALRLKLWSLPLRLPKIEIQLGAMEVDDLELLAQQAQSAAPLRHWFTSAAQGVLMSMTGQKSAQTDVANLIQELGETIWPDFRMPQVVPPRKTSSRQH